MELEVILEWRPGVQHQLADALSRATGVEPHGDDINDAFPGNNGTAGTDQLPNGPILDGVPLSVLGSTREDGKGHVVASLAIAPVISPAAFAAVALTPVVNDTSPNAAYYVLIVFDADARTTVTKPAPPTAVALGCGGGESIPASEGILEVLGATDHDWRALECTRHNVLPRTALQRTTPGTIICRFWIKQLHPEVLIGYACRSVTETGLEKTREATRAAVPHSHLRGLSGPPSDVAVHITSTKVTRVDRFNAFPRAAECDWETVFQVSALRVGVPCNRKMTYITCARRTPRSKEKLLRRITTLEWQEKKQRSLGEYLGREGVYFLHRAQGEQAIFSFNNPIVSLSRGPTSGEKPAGLYNPHPADEGTFDEAQELDLLDFVKIATRKEGFLLPATVSRAAASILADSTPTKMMKAVLVSLLDAEMFTNQRLHRRASSEPEGLMCAAFTDLHAIDTEEHPQPGSTTALPRGTGVGWHNLRHRNVRPSSHASQVPSAPRSLPSPPPPLGPAPSTSTPLPPTPVKPTPPLTTRTSRAKAPPSSSMPSWPTPPPSALLMPTPSPTTRPPTPLPTLPTPSPTPPPAPSTSPCQAHLCPPIVQHMLQVLLDTPELVKRQAKDSFLANAISNVKKKGGCDPYMLDEERLLWYSSITSPSRLAMPRSMIPGVMALVHTTYAHPEVGRTTELIQRKFRLAHVQARR